MTSRRQQRETRTDGFDAAALEHELHAKQRGSNRQDRRADGRAAEASGFSRVVGKHFRSRPTGGQS